MDRCIPTTKEEITEIHARLTKTFQSGHTLPLPYRRHQILQIARLVQENSQSITDSVSADIGRPAFETVFLELGVIVESCISAAESLEEWVEPERPEVDEWRRGWDTTVWNVPKGTVILIVPWNFPWVISLLPLFGAIAAGCTAFIKPSERSPHSSALMKELVSRYLDPEAYAVGLGAGEEAAHAMTLQWDHVFFAGGTAEGRMVAEAAAKFVTPLTLELGGQSSVFVDGESADLDVAAKRILWGKFLNGGQMCVSPNHVFIEAKYQSAFVKALKRAFEAFCPNGGLASSTRMVNVHQYERIKRLLRDTKGKVVVGGRAGRNLRIETAVVMDVGMDDVLMEEEIFGPILPIVPVANVDEAISHMRSGFSPLVIYFFTENEEIKNKLLWYTRSGQLIQNETIGQLNVPEIPFGGQGQSGYGAYGGKHSFDTFIHKRGFINIPTDPKTEGLMQGRYPPYSVQALEFFSQPLMMEIPEY